MKLKTKLIVSFCIILVVPIICIGLFGLAITYMQRTNIIETYGPDAFAESGYNYLTNAFQFVYGLTKEDYETLQNADVSELSSKEYLDKLNKELEEKSSFLLVRKGDELVYKGTEEESLIPKTLPPYGESNKNMEWGTYIEGSVQAMVKQYDFVYDDQSQGSAFIVTTAQQILPKWKEMIFDAIFCIVLILLLTAATICLWIYQGIINPLRKLQVATQNIKEGNLDFTVETDQKDEIGDLSRSFEEMRQRLKESSEEKLAAEKENKMLIRNISHDLKTPITAIKGYAEGIMDGVADTPEKQEKYLRTIYNKTNEMTTLINELTLYAQIDTNRIPYNFAKINVADYFNDCVEEIGLDLEAKDIGLSYFNYVDNTVQIIADPEQLGRVIHNIINNSVKYMDKPKGLINIRIKDVGDFIQVEIEDNGKGIGAKDLPYIFDRFYRTDESRNSATGGSGIGLSIVRKIIEDHGGKIWATSKLATGTVMYFVLRKYQEVPNE